MRSNQSTVHKRLYDRTFEVKDWRDMSKGPYTVDFINKTCTCKAATMPCEHIEYIGKVIALEEKKAKDDGRKLRW